MPNIYINRLATRLFKLPRFLKQSIALGLDASLCIFSTWFAFYLRLGNFVQLESIPHIAFIASVILAIPIFIFFGMYRAIFRYSGWPAFTTVAKAAVIYGISYALVFTVIGVDGVPRTIGIIQPTLLLAFIGLLRVLMRFILGGASTGGWRNQSHLPRVLIYGAGSAGRQITAALQSTRQMNVLGYLDDNSNLQGGTLNGLKIFNPMNLEDLSKSLNITDILLAIPSASRARRNQILDLIAKSKINVRTLPSFIDVAQGKIAVSDIKELEIEDLLGREPIKPRVDLLTRNIFNEVVMVSGAGGSIGSELCRQILKNSPKKLVLFEQNEYALYRIHQQLLLQNKILSEKEGLQISEIVCILGSVRDVSLVDQALKTHRPKTIFHAAAYKHVPLVEENYSQGIKNNIYGTQVLALAAAKYEVANFVLVSTDKAVRPTNVMGATKRISELVLQSLANSVASKKTVFSMVRFGNVLDSSGSVVPLFRRQIKDGGPITVTHPEVTRYFMTIPEAASLVIQAGAMAQGGEVFVLDMGQPVKIIDLARHIIELSGLEERSIDNLHGDIEIQISGLRPGEKLYEELLIGDNPLKTDHPLIMKAQEEFIPKEVLDTKLSMLEGLIDQVSLDEAKELLKDLVPGYMPTA